MPEIARTGEVVPTETDDEKVYVAIPVPYCSQCAKPWILRVSWRIFGKPTTEWMFARDCACWDTTVKPRVRPEPVLKYLNDDPSRPYMAALHVLDLEPMEFNEDGSRRDG